MVQDPLRGPLVSVSVKTLLLDPTQNTPVLILEEDLAGAGDESEPSATGTGTGAAPQDSAEPTDSADAAQSAESEPHQSQRKKRSPRLARLLPIWIGLFEASAIQMYLEGTQLPRPLTHDLMANLFEALDGQLIAVVVHSLEEGTFYATLRIQAGDHLVDVDARPSDAVALALRCEAEIFVAEHVFTSMEDRERPQHEREKALKEWFENLDPDDLGKYTM